MIKQLKTILVPNVVAPCPAPIIADYNADREKNEAELAEAVRDGYTIFATHTMVVDKVGYVVYILIKE